MSEAYKFIDEYKKLITHFGQWPSFHDAEVHALGLHRPAKNTSNKGIPTLDLHLRGWKLVCEAGRYKLHGDAVVHFQFDGIFDLRLEGFNNQKVLSSMDLGIVDDPVFPGDSVLLVELVHCYEFETSFKARSARILNITPYVQLLAPLPLAAEGLLPPQDRN